MRFSILRLLGYVSLAALLLTAILHVKANFMSPYTSWEVGDLVVDYMQANGNQWPRSWEQLDAFYKSSGKKYNNFNSLDYIKTRFEIDFEFDPKPYFGKISPGEKFDPVEYKVWRSYVGGHEANDQIRNYLWGQH